MDMDNRDRILGNPPDTILHKIASIVPGYEGYVDRERRRDADKLLRVQLARRYAEVRERLTRIQQSLVRERKLDQLDDIEAISGSLQRFIDRLSTATYGYTGLFDPIRIEAQDLDQLYAFDLSLTQGVDQLQSALDAVESAVSGPDGDELRSALGRLADEVDELNRRLNQRTDLITSGARLPSDEYARLMDRLNLKRDVAPPGSVERPGTSGPAVITPFAGETSNLPQQARVTGPSGESTTNLNVGLTANQPPAPGLSQMSEGNFSLSEAPSGVSMEQEKAGTMPVGGSAGTGIQTASSPTSAPGAPGGDIVEGLEMQSRMGGTDAGINHEGLTPPTGAPPDPTRPNDAREQGRMP
jgi:hypothetical protein